ncbi:MAG: hypothetical protein ACKO4U_05095, partial [Caldilinea sp.]
MACVALAELLSLLHTTAFAAKALVWRVPPIASRLLCFPHESVLTGAGRTAPPPAQPLHGCTTPSLPLKFARPLAQPALHHDLGL